MNFKQTPRGINYLHEYYPTRYEEHKGVSESILRFKNGDEDEIERFAYEIMEALINKAENDEDGYEDMCVVIVPSHSFGEWSRSLRNLATIVCKELQMLNYSRALRRIKSHEKLSTGGERSVESHLKTIVKASHDIEGREVLLLDDITTTGNSILACEEILRKAGAARVEAVAIGQTVKGTLKNSVN